MYFTSSFFLADLPDGARRKYSICWCNCKASAAAGGDGNTNRKVTEKEATTRPRCGGKVRIIKRGSLLRVKARLETVPQLTVATERLAKGAEGTRGGRGARRKGGGGTGWEEGKVGLERLETVAHFPVTVADLSKWGCQRKERNRRDEEGGGKLKKKKRRRSLARRRRGEGETEARQRWNQRLIGHFTSFHPTVKWISSKRFETLLEVMGDLDVFPSAGWSHFNRLPEWRKYTHCMARWKEPFRGSTTVGASSYCSRLCRLVFSHVLMFSAEGTDKEKSFLYWSMYGTVVLEYLKFKR